MKETLEEAAKGYSERHQDVSGNLGKYLVSAVFQDGAEWMQERMYSEEDMKTAFFSGGDMREIEEFNFWFKKFKKK